MKKRLGIACVLGFAALVSSVNAGINVGAAQRDITMPVGLEIQHYFRTSDGVHDPLYARCLYLQDDTGTAIAIVCVDLIMGKFDVCDQLRSEIRKETGIEHTLINFSHNHSSAELGPRGRSRISNDAGSKWNDATLDSIMSVVKEAKANAEPATLRAGRADARVGFNRRLVNPKTGSVFMGVNRDGPNVTWVNILVADSQKTGKPISVLFETAAHPVVVPHTTNKISADYPGAAIRRLRETLGEDVIAMFGQGCAGNINGFPLRSSYANAVTRGNELAESVLRAIESSKPLSAESLSITFAQAVLPSHPLPTVAEVDQWIHENQENESRVNRLQNLRRLAQQRQQPPTRRFDAYALAIGNEWCLTTMPHEMFCQYELWIDDHAPFDHTMTFAYTNGYQGYVAVDEAWRLGPKGGYEAASLPNWGGQVHTEHFGPPAVGSEKIIKDSLESLWPKSVPIQPATDAPQPKSPAESAKHIRMPNGFRIKLVASEPVVQDPSCVAFDEFGRMFVCELHGYNIEGHLDTQALNKTGKLDRKVRRLRWEFMDGDIARQAAELQRGVVKMLIDSNQDGVMDDSEVWADDLPPAYGVVPARGGIIVVCAPDIVFLADRDGDGKVDERETLFTGFRTQTIERGINNPRWGLDNWIYVGAGGSGGTISGPHLPHDVELSHSDFRIKPDGTAIEPVTGRVGTFGMTINEVGDRFPASGGQPATYALPLPHRYLKRNPFVPTPNTNYSSVAYNQGFRISEPHPWRVKRRQDPAWVKFYGDRETNSNYFSGGCSNEFYGDPLFPTEYQGNLFYCEPSLNIVHRCVVEREGAAYRGRRAPSEQESEFLASTDQWFRPMNLRVGPDGSLFIVDMYREIIEDYSAIPRFLQQQYGLNKGSDYGRIWRLLPDNAQDRQLPNLASKDNEDLARMTADSHMWRRKTAQRLLIERQATSIDEILRTGLEASQSHHACIHALHTLAGLGQLRAGDVVTAMLHPHFAARLHGVRLAEHWLNTDANVKRSVITLCEDHDPAVRLQVAMTLGQCDGLDQLDSPSRDALLRIAEKYGNDRWMVAAILSSVESVADKLVTSLLSDNEVSVAATPLLQPLCATIASQRNALAIANLLGRLQRHTATTQTLCLRGLVAGLSQGNEPAPKSDHDWPALTSLMQSRADEVRELTIQVSSKLNVSNTVELNKIYARAAERAIDESLPEEQRRDSIAALSTAPFELLASVARDLLVPQETANIQLDAIRLLDTSDDPRVADVLLEHYPRLTPIVRKTAIKVFTARTNRISRLLSGFETDTIPISDLTPSARERLLADTRSDVAIRAKRLFQNTDSSIPSDLRASYVKALSFPRSVSRGRQVFEKHCLACHKIDDQGFEVGPALGSIVNRPDETLLMDILDPSDRIEPEYRSYLISTTNGRSLTGVMVSESPTSITLRQEKGVTLTVLRRDIEQMKASTLSLMPANLHEQIQPPQMADLLTFLRRAFSKPARKSERIRLLRQRGATVFQKGEDVVEVNANRTQINDDELILLADFTKITDLSLEQTSISDAGVAHLRKLQNLEWLNLYRCAVTNISLSVISGFPKLQHLPIGSSQITDEGLRHVAGMKRLVYLGLRDTQITDEGVAKLSSLTNLTGLHLAETRITNAAIAHLARLQKLRQLWLDHTQITDDVVPSLLKLNALRELHITHTKISEKGVRDIRLGLPMCEVIGKPR